MNNLKNRKIRKNIRNFERGRERERKIRRKKEKNNFFKKCKEK